MKLYWSRTSGGGAAGSSGQSALGACARSPGVSGSWPRPTTLMHACWRWYAERAVLKFRELPDEQTRELRAVCARRDDLLDCRGTKPARARASH
jgi:hypothetical protein